MDQASLQKVKGQMHSFAMGDAMAQAARDYQKELLARQENSAGAGVPAFYAEDMLDDPDLERLHAERLAELKAEAERRTSRPAQALYGSLTEIAEAEFLGSVMKADNVVCHLFHPSFARCATMDRHLALLAQKYTATCFLRISAPDAPFFTEKLKIRILPCVIMFKKGVAVDRITGFEGIQGAGNDFKTDALEGRLNLADVLRQPRLQESEEFDRPATSSIRHGFQRTLKKSESDEDSDFSD